MKENNPEGVGDVNGDGKVDYKDYAEEAKKAAGEVCSEVAEKAKDIGSDVIGKAQELAGMTEDKADEA